MAFGGEVRCVPGSRRFPCLVAALAVVFGGVARPAWAHPAATPPGPLPAFRELFAPGEHQAPSARAWSHLFEATPEDLPHGAPPPLGLDPPLVPDPTWEGRWKVPPAGSSPSITWGPLLWQTLEFLVFQHSVRAGFEENTWQKTIEGPFWDDYFTSVSNLCCWTDGDKVTTNYLFHPLMGSAAAFVFSNNHRDSKVTPPGMNGKYWGAKAKQGLYAFAYSTYFEIGLVLSEAAIGNIGMTGEGMTWCDIVITPAVGLAISAGEDALRSTLIDRLDRWNHFWGATAAIFLNPTRSFSNLMAWKIPWTDPPWLTLKREAQARERARRTAGR
jgi:hypothetical protein